MVVPSGGPIVRVKATIEAIQFTAFIIFFAPLIERFHSSGDLFSRLSKGIASNFSKSLKTFFKRDSKLIECKEIRIHQVICFERKMEF